MGEGLGGFCNLQHLVHLLKLSSSFHIGGVGLQKGGGKPSVLCNEGQGFGDGGAFL